MDCDGASVSDTEKRNTTQLQSGAAFLSILGALIILSALAAGILLGLPQAPFTTFAGVNEMRAYYLALSGLNLWKDGRDGVFSIGKDSITLSQSSPDATGQTTVTSIGTVRPGYGLETNCCLTEKRQTTAIITFQNDIDDFKTPTLGQTTNNSSAILVFGTNGENPPDGMSYATWSDLFAQNSLRYAAGWVQLGGNEKTTTAALWYAGNKAICQTGKCSLGTGLRAYFAFSFKTYDDSLDSKKYGDGFTFTVVTAENNPETAAGSSGEYLGYAGPGPSGQGILPPKIALEVDTYPNRGSAAPETPNSRRDHSDANHIAVLYWATQDSSYDDNVHGLGSDPQNPIAVQPGYYEQAAATLQAPNWLEDAAQHTLRLEIHRTTGAQEGDYTVLAWIDPVQQGASDVTADYTAESPLVTSAVHFDAASHKKMDTVYFGWTEATGEESQCVDIHDFALAFRQ